MNIYRSILLGASLATLPVISHADLGPIVITPTRTEQAGNTSSATVYVMTADDIKNSGIATTSELLRGIPGVQIDDLFGNGTEVTISLRGFSSTANANTLVLVNGRRLNYSDTASPDLHHILPKNIERIEVLAGSAGSLYGDQAVGGVINIITKKPEDDYQQITARLGSYENIGVDFTSSKQLNETLGYRLSLGHFESDHYRDNNTQENTNFSGILDYNEAGTAAFLEVQRVSDDLELPGALIESEYQANPKQSNSGFIDDFRDEEVSVFRLGFAQEFGQHRFSIDATHRKTDADIRQSFRDNPSPDVGFSKRKNNSINPKVSGLISNSYAVPYVIGIDLEAIEYALEIPYDFFGPGITQTSNNQDLRSLFFQLTPDLTDKLRFTFGTRYSEVENDMVDEGSFGAFPAGIEINDDIFVHELGLAYQIDEETRFSARIDQNFRFAKVNELTLAGVGLILETQTGDSFELGFNLTRGNHQLIGSLYRLDLENEIQYDPNAGTFGENVNLDNTRRDGVTLSWLAQLNTAFSLKAELGMVDAKFHSGTFNGNDISGVSDQIIRVRGDYRVNDSVTTFLETNYSSPRYAQADNANLFGKLGSITLINVGLGYTYKSWDMSFRVNNLNDENYAEFVTNNGTTAFQPSPDRNFTLTAGYNFE